MKNLKQLKTLLEHEKNDPIQVIKLFYYDRTEKSKKSSSDLAFYINIYYCCFNTSSMGNKDSGSLDANEKIILKAIGKNEAVLLKLKYNDLLAFKRGFNREMHWIRQMNIRMTRFEHITKVVYDKVDEIIKSLGKLDVYVKDNFDVITKKLPVKPEQIKLEKLSKIEILELIAKGEVTPARAKQFIDKIDKDEFEKNSDKLCPFSGSGRNAYQATRICSRTGDPKKLGDCGSCRVAAEWEECYG